MVGGWLRREPEKAPEPGPERPGTARRAPDDAEDTTTWDGWDPGSRPQSWDEPTRPAPFGNGAVTEPVRMTPGAPGVYRSRRHQAEPPDEVDEPTTVLRLDQTPSGTAGSRAETQEDTDRAGYRREPHPRPAGPDDHTERHLTASEQHEDQTLRHIRAATSPDEQTVRYAQEGPTVQYVEEGPTVRDVRGDPTARDVREDPTVQHVSEDLTVPDAREAGVDDDRTVQHTAETGRDHTGQLRLGTGPQQLDQTVQHTPEPELWPNRDETVRSGREDELPEEQTLRFTRVARRRAGDAQSGRPGIVTEPESRMEPLVTVHPDVSARMEFTAYQEVVADPENSVESVAAQAETTDSRSDDPSEGDATDARLTAGLIAGLIENGEGDAYAGSAEWGRHSNERWVVGDAGDQATARIRVPHRFRNPPADTTIDGAEVGAVVYRAASVRGVSHQERGEPRQDAYTVRFTRDHRWLVGCISDGVSSAARSHEAAAVICDRISGALVDHLLESPPSDDPERWTDEIGAVPWDRVVRAANHAVGELARPYLSGAAQRRGGRLDPAGPVAHDQARTIMAGTATAFVVATEASPDGTHRAMLADIAGDSAAFTLQDGRWTPLTRIRNEGEAVLSRPVRSLPGMAEVDARPLHLRPGALLIMMTDGLRDPLGAATGAVSRFLADRWRTPPDLLAFAQHLAFYRETFTDDRTAIAVWPASAGGETAGG